MRLFGSLSELVASVFRKDNQSITLRPNQTTTYTADRDVQLPQNNAAEVIVGRTSADQGASRLKNKDLEDSTVAFADNSDATKKMQFELSGITTATTRTLTVPDASDTIAVIATAQTLTNKTINADNNTITNIDNNEIKALAAIDATKIADGSVDNTEFQRLGTAGGNAAGDFVTTNGTQTLTNKTHTLPQILEGGGGSDVLIIVPAAQTTTRNVIIPNLSANDTIVFEAQAQTLTNKTISGASNTISNINLATQVTGTLPIGNGGTGQTTQTNAFDALAPTTTKGDLIAHNGTDNIRVPVGTNGYALVADSGAASGLSYAAVATDALNEFNIKVGNSSNIATSVDTSAVGDISASSVTGLNIKTGVIVNADVNAAAAIDGTKISPNFGSQTVQSTGAGNFGSATITGDLTVDTNTLKVDSTNNRVGILTATPSYPLHIATANAGNFIGYFGAGGAGNADALVALDAGSAAGSEALLYFNHNGSSTSGAFMGTSISDTEFKIRTFNSYNIALAPDNTTRLDVTTAGIAVTGTASVSGVLSLNTTDVNTVDHFVGATNAAGDPTFTFTGDTNTGMYAVGADNIGFSAGGTLQMDISTTRITGAVGFLGPAGSASSAGLATGAANVGLYRTAADKLGFTTGGVADMELIAGTSNYGQLNLGVNAVGAANDNVSLEIRAPNASTLTWVHSDANTTFTVALFGSGTGAFVTAGSIVINTTTDTTAYNTSSDSRRKMNVDNTYDALAILSQLNPVKYNWVADEQGPEEYGLIAQEVHQVLPYVVQVGGEDAGRNPWGLDYSKLVGLLVRANKQQQAQISNLTARIEALEV